MANVMTTKLSSKGQVVLPETLRQMYGWQSGTSFTILAYKGAVIMQPIKIPTETELAAEFDEACAESRHLAKEAGMTPADISNAISEVRSARRSRRSRR